MQKPRGAFLVALVLALLIAVVWNTSYLQLLIFPDATLSMYVNVGRGEALKNSAWNPFLPRSTRMQAFGSFVAQQDSQGITVYLSEAEIKEGQHAFPSTPIETWDFFRAPFIKEAINPVLEGRILSPSQDSEQRIALLLRILESIPEESSSALREIDNLWFRLDGDEVQEIILRAFEKDGANGCLFTKWQPPLSN